MPAAVAYRRSTGSSSLDALQDSQGEDAELDDEDDLPEDLLTQDTKTEQVDLLLPSSPISIRQSFASPSLSNKEARLRVGRSESHLTELQRLLRVKAGVMVDKRANSVGQKSGTRSNTVLADYRLKIDRTASYYTEERKLAMQLDPTGSWQLRLKELMKEDVRPVHANAAEEIGAVSLTASDRVLREGQRTISWIWKVPLAISSVDMPSSEMDSAILTKEIGETDQGSFSTY